MSENNIHDKIHTTRLSEVVEAEQLYIDTRRKNNDITELEAKEGNWGIAASSGGVRAGVLLLGFSKKLMEKNFFRRIDYLSAVEGSGLMAACLSSLLTGKKSIKGAFGVQPENAPFCPNTNPHEGTPSGGITPTTQVSYLKKNIRDINPRFWKNLGKGRGLFGIGISGVSYGGIVLLCILMSFVALHHAYLFTISDGAFQQFIMDYKTVPVYKWQYAGDVFGWLTEGFPEFFRKINEEFTSSYYLWGIAAGIGAFGTLIFFLFYLRPSLKRNVSNITIEVKVNEFYYYGFILNYICLFCLGLLVWGKGEQYWQVFIMPVFLMLGVLVTSMFGSFITRKLAVEDQNRRALVAEISTAGFLMLLAAITFPFVLITLLLTGGWTTLLSSFLFFIISLYLTSRRIKKLTQIKSMHWRGNLWPNLFLLLSIAGLGAAMGKMLLYLSEHEGDYNELWYYLGAALPLVLLFFLGLSIRNIKHTNLYKHFKNRNGKMYLSTITEHRRPLRDDTDLPLHKILDDNEQGPYLILNASLNVHASADDMASEQRALPFIFSKYFIGSRKTGFIKSEVYENGSITLADAMTASSASFHSGMGVHGFYAQAFIFTLLSLRLGTWLPNPWYYRKKNPKHSRGKSRFMNFIREFMNRFSTRSHAVNVSGGIHTGDYWGLTPLLQRRCKNIIVCDFRSSEDMIPGHLDLPAIRGIANRYKARLGEKFVSAPLCDHHIGDLNLCDKNVLSCQISYDDGTKGRLYYIKSKLSTKLPDSVLDYHRSHPDFPNVYDSTMRQQDLQFNSYMVLGENLADQFLQTQRQDTMDSFDAMLRERIRQIDDEIRKSEGRKREISALSEAIEHRQKQIRREKELEELNIRELEKRERVVVEALTVLRIAKAKSDDLVEKHKLNSEIIPLEIELSDLRYQLKQKDRESRYPDKEQLSTLQNLINNLLTLTQRSQIYREMLKTDQQQLIDKQVQLNELSAKLDELSEIQFKREVKDVNRILIHIEEVLNSQGIRQPADISKIRKALYDLLGKNET